MRARRGELIVFPTDTVYGIAARPDDAAATARLFEAKRRPLDLTLPVLVGRSTTRERSACSTIAPSGSPSALWPGSADPRRDAGPRSGAWQLGGDRDSVGVRIPDHPTGAGRARRPGHSRRRARTGRGSRPPRRVRSCTLPSATTSRCTCATTARSRDALRRWSRSSVRSRRSFGPATSTPTSVARLSAG
jgi:hypothetical protein